MRKLLIWIISVILFLSLGVSASAATGASKLDSFATVSSDGSCQVSMTLTLHMEQAMDKLYFPIPKDATGVTLNGSRVSASRSGDARRINLSRLVRNVVGDVTVSIHYSLYDVIHTTEAGTLEMRVPMLSGFEYPIENMTFSLTLPGAAEALPGFVSGYHQARIEEDLTYQVTGATITGSSLKAMKDHETLTMTMVVTPEMFPRTITHTQSYDGGLTAMYICAALALVYWLIALWNLPVRPQSCTEPPHGFNAGQLGSIIAGQGTSLSLMVLSWAELGYVRLRTERQRVLIHRRMDMGNERSEFELRCFQKLFGKRSVVDTSDYRYAQLSLAMAKRPDGMKELTSRWSGNKQIFRGIAAGIGLFGGACLAVALAGGAALQGFLIFVLSVAGGISGWFIQDLGAGLILRDRHKLTAGGLLSAAWLVLGLLAEAFTLSLWMVIGLTVAGLGLAWGGRKTSLGRQTQAQVLGLQRYLRKADKSQLQRLCESDPDHFFRLAPYALALGVDASFARQFGSVKLERCPYLANNSQMPMSALQWSALLRKTVDTMDQRARSLPMEKLLGMIHSMIKR